MNNTNSISKNYCIGGDRIGNPPDILSNIDRKVGDVSYHILNSYLAGMVFKAAGGLVFASVVVIAGLPLLLISIPAFCLTIEIVRLRKEILFEITLLYTIGTTPEWWSPITPHIVLSAIPLSNHLQTLKDEKINSVLTILEDFEVEEGLVTPISSRDWKESNIEHYHLCVQDFFGVPSNKIHEGVVWMHGQITQNKKVLVHCKAGRGRSATAVISYLLKYGHDNSKYNNFREAYDFVKALRPQININSGQQSTIEEYVLNYIMQKK